jgi:hypothetical protein
VKRNYDLFGAALSVVERLPPTRDTAYYVFLGSAVLLALIDTLIVTVYPHEQKFPVKGAISGSADSNNPFTNKLLYGRSGVTYVFYILSIFIYLPFIYNLPKHAQNVSDLIIYLSRVLVILLFVGGISTMFDLLSTYSIEKFNYCPEKEQSLPLLEGSFTCHRNTWARILAVVSDVVKQVLTSVTFMGTTATAIVFPSIFFYMVVLYCGYVNAHAA